RVRVAGGCLRGPPQLLPTGDALRRPADGDGVHERRNGRSADRGSARTAGGAPRQVPRARDPVRRGRSTAERRRRANGAATREARLRRDQALPPDRLSPERSGAWAALRLRRRAGDPGLDPLLPAVERAVPGRADRADETRSSHWPAARPRALRA